MKIKAYELLGLTMQDGQHFMGLYEALLSLSNQLNEIPSVSAALVYGVSKNLRLLRGEVESLEKQLTTLQQSHIKKEKEKVKGEDGKMKTVEKPVPAKDKKGKEIPGQFELKDPQKFSKDLQEFYHLEIDIDVHKLKLKHFDEVKVSGEVMNVLFPIIEE